MPLALEDRNEAMALQFGHDQSGTNPPGMTASSMAPSCAATTSFFAASLGLRRARLGVFAVLPRQEAGRNDLRHRRLQSVLEAADDVAVARIIAANPVWATPAALAFLAAPTLVSSIPARSKN